MLWALQYAHRGRHICIYANMFYLFEKVKEDKRNSPRMPKMTCHLLRPVLSWISWSPSPISAFRPPAVQKKSMKTPQIKDIHITISSIYQRTTSTNDQAELSVHIINKDRPEPERRTVIPRPQPHRSSSQLTRFNFLRANSVPLLRLLHLCHLRPLALAAFDWSPFYFLILTCLITFCSNNRWYPDQLCHLVWPTPYLGRSIHGKIIYTLDQYLNIYICHWGENFSNPTLSCDRCDQAR